MVVGSDVVEVADAGLGLAAQSDTEEYCSTRRTNVAAVVVAVAVVAIEAVDAATCVMFVGQKLAGSDFHILFAVELVAVGVVPVAGAADTVAVVVAAAAVQLVEDTAEGSHQCCWTLEPSAPHQPPGDLEHRPIVVAAAAVVAPEQLAAVAVAVDIVAVVAAAAAQTPAVDSNSLNSTDCSEQPGQQHPVPPLDCRH